MYHNLVYQTLTDTWILSVLQMTLCVYSYIKFWTTVYFTFDEFLKLEFLDQRAFDTLLPDNLREVELSFSPTTMYELPIYLLLASTR